jgi:hypothetical protein
VSTRLFLVSEPDAGCGSLQPIKHPLSLVRNQDESDSLEARRKELYDAVRGCARHYLATLRRPIPASLRQRLHDLARSDSDVRFNFGPVLALLDAAEASTAPFSFSDAMRQVTALRLPAQSESIQEAYLDHLLANSQATTVRARFDSERTVPLWEPALRYSQHELHKLERYVDLISRWQLPANGRAQ